MYFEPVSARESTLAWLLPPVPVSTFLDQLWGAAPHHIDRGGRADHFDRLAEPADPERLLAALRTEPSAVRLVRGSDQLQPEQYTLADGPCHG